MEVIRVPAPPEEAFHKGRPISDLIKAQVNHFKHLEEKLPIERLQKVPQLRITTENDAALYIAAMTRLLREGVTTTPAMHKTTAKEESESGATSSSGGLVTADPVAQKAATPGQSKPKPARKRKR